MFISFLFLIFNFIYLGRFLGCLWKHELFLETVTIHHVVRLFFSIEILQKTVFTNNLEL